MLSWQHLHCSPKFSAVVSGQLDDVVAQYDDTPEAQHNAELRAAEQEMQDKLEEYRKQQEAALREEYGMLTPKHVCLPVFDVALVLSLPHAGA